LTEGERRKLEMALAELGDHPLGELAGQLAEPARPVSGVEQDARWLSRHLAQLCQVIHAEPAWLWPTIGTALGVSLRKEVLAMMGAFTPCADKADAVRRYWQSCGEPLAPELRAAVLQQLVAQARNYPAPAPDTARTKPGFLARLLRKRHG
jgi:hypothetical protein